MSKSESRFERPRNSLPKTAIGRSYDKHMRHFLPGDRMPLNLTRGERIALLFGAVIAAATVGMPSCTDTAEKPNAGFDVECPRDDNGLLRVKVTDDEPHYVEQVIMEPGDTAQKLIDSFDVDDHGLALGRSTSPEATRIVDELFYRMAELNSASRPDISEAMTGGTSAVSSNLTRATGQPLAIPVCEVVPANG